MKIQDQKAQKKVIYFLHFLFEFSLFDILPVSKRLRAIKEEQVPNKN
jgi:hypothetical protein